MRPSLILASFVLPFSAFAAPISCQTSHGNGLAIHSQDTLISQTSWENNFHEPHGHPRPDEQAHSLISRGLHGFLKLPEWMGGKAAAPVKAPAPKLLGWIEGKKAPPSPAKKPWFGGKKAAPPAKQPWFGGNKAPAESPRKHDQLGSVPLTTIPAPAPIVPVMPMGKRLEQFRDSINRRGLSWLW